MTRKWFRIAVLISAVSVLGSLSSCARNQHLVSIAVQPATVTFGSVDDKLFVSLTAYGAYQHPPETKDITTRVTLEIGYPPSCASYHCRRRQPEHQLWHRRHHRYIQ